MKNLFAALVAPAFLCGALLAQNTPSSAPDPGSTQPSSTQPGATQPAQSPAETQPQTQPAAPTGTKASTAGAPAGNPLKIAPGSVIPVQMAKTIDAKKAKTGDEVVATVTQDMKSNSGDVLVPKDTKIVGHVTEAQARSKEQKESQLGITFDHAVVKGDQMPLPMSIQAIIAPPTNTPNASAGTSEAPASPSASSTSPMGGRPATSGANPSSSAQNSPQGGASDAPPQTAERPPITGNTQGVIGMPDMKLDNNAQNAAQGSIVTSEKNNVKIEKGTFMLLRVNQAGQQ
jgi:hypothetical protein